MVFSYNAGIPEVSGSANGTFTLNVPIKSAMEGVFGFEAGGALRKRSFAGNRNPGLLHLRNIGRLALLYESAVY